MSAAPKLRVVDSDTGEVAENNKLTRALAEIDRLKTDLKMAKRDVTAKNRRIAELERDKVRERMYYERREDVERVAVYWWRKCRGANPRVNPMTPDRFDAVRAMMEICDFEIVEGKRGGKQRRKLGPHYSMDDFKMAIDGAAYDPYIETFRNGTQHRHDDLAQICADTKRFDRFIRKAPKPRPEPPRSCPPLDRAVAEVDAAFERLRT